MQPKAFLWLVLLAALAAGLGVYLHLAGSRRQAEGSGISGRPLLPGLPVNDITAVTVVAPEATLKLARKDGLWRVPLRWDYPADFAAVSRLLLALQDAKATQAVQAGESQWAQLKLLPASGTAAGAGTEITLEAGLEKFILILGKNSGRAGADDEELPLGAAGAGRFVRVPATGLLAVSSADFGLYDLKAQSWLDAEFIKVTDVKVATLEKDGKLLWTLQREKTGDDLKLAEAKAEDNLDGNKLRTLANALAWIRFTDIAGRADIAESAVPVMPWRYTVSDFDGFTVTLNVSGADAEGKFRGTAAILYKGPESRTPAADEKAEDKAKNDAAFAKKQQENRQKAEELQRKLSGWVYLFDKFALEGILLDRAGLMKAPEKPGDAKPAGAIPGFPGLPPGIIPAAPAP